MTGSTSSGTISPVVYHKKLRKFNKNSNKPSKTRGKREVTIDLEVSHKDHPHLIGKKGCKIRSMTEKSGAVMDFPNKPGSLNQPVNKGYIIGEVENAERARQLLRMNSPVSYNFHISGLDAHQINVGLKSVAERPEFKDVHIIVHNCRTVIVRGPEFDAPTVKRATQMLINVFCGEQAETTKVNLEMRISPEYLRIVRGFNDELSSAIMYYTRTQITFSESEELDSSWINICGDVHGVLKAKRMIIGSLPVSITFDVNRNQNQNLNNEKLWEIQQTYGINVDFQVLNYWNTVCTVTASERYINELYEARRLILGCDEPFVEAILPRDYFIPNNDEEYYYSEEFNWSEETIDEDFDSVSMINVNISVDVPKEISITSNLKSNQMSQEQAISVGNQMVQDKAVSNSKQLDNDQVIVYQYFAKAPKNREDVATQITLLIRDIAFVDRKAPGSEMRIIIKKMSTMQDVWYY